MKLQIDNQHLRLRIDERELATLLAGEQITTRTQFSGAFAISFTLQLTVADDASLVGQPEAWTIAVPHAAVTAHAARLPTREGLKFLLPVHANAEALTLLFDVDVRDSVRRRKAG